MSASHDFSHFDYQTASSMSSINQQLFQILQTVQSPGDFYTKGAIETFPPLVEVDGVGRVALPLLPLQTEHLVAVAERAPYGRGQETLVDTEVRRTWQIDASRVTLGGKHWQTTLDRIVDRAALGLGVNDKVEAELYKLLVYDTGSFFISHRDTEKAPGMFATLVIVLPSSYSGGELVVKHLQQDVKLDLRCTDPAEIAYAAFYADCLHEVLPITEGCRLTLIYNLMRANKKLPLPTPPDYRHEQDTVAALLTEWAERLSMENAEKETPEKLIYLLEHAYTQAELGFDALKNTDAAIAEVLVAAGGQADCDIHLALVSIEESGDAEYTGYGRYRDDDAFEVGEVYERTETVSDWRRPDGGKPELPTLPFAEYEFCQPDAFENMAFDDVQFQEATGNAGASFERTYHCAALVLWPHSYYLAIINQAGFSAALAVLQELCRGYEAAGDKTQGSRHWQDAHRLAGYMLRDWLQQCLGHQSVYSRDSRLREFLECLYCLQDNQQIARFWSLFAENGICNKDDCAMLVQVAGLLPWPQVVEGLTRAVSIMAGNKAQEACAALLASFSQAHPDTAKDLGAAARVLFEALPGDAARFAHLNPWDHARMAVNDGLVVDVLAGFSGIDAALAETALDYLLAWPGTYKMDAVLAPAALSLAGAGASRNLPVAVRLRLAVITHVQKRVAEDLSPPADWRRNSQLKCDCKDCAELSLFLDNPNQEIWRFKAAENRREHITQTISRRLCDVDQKTEKLSRPYSLICTKNQASYQGRVAQRQKDLGILARLSVEGVVNER